MAKKGRGGWRPPGGAGGMERQLQEIQARVQQAQQELSSETVTVTAGGGVVEVTMTGQQRLVAVSIAPEVLEEGDVELLQDMLVGAFNEAVRKSQELAAQKLGPLAGGLL